MKMTPETPREKKLDLRNLTRPNWHILLQEAMENFVFPDEIKTKFMEANCFVKNASLLTFDVLKIFKKGVVSASF